MSLYFQLKKVFGTAETPEFSGKCIAYLLAGEWCEGVSKDLSMRVFVAQTYQYFCRRLPTNTVRLVDDGVTSLHP